MKEGFDPFIFDCFTADSRKRWILPIIILSSGGVFVLIIAAVYGIKTKKCASSDNLAKCKLRNVSFKLH